MQTIRKSIYIGLGGTGVKAIAQTKRMFEETFGMGNIPPQVTFLALDYDRSAIDECGLATDISSDFVQLPLSVNPFLIHQAECHREKYSWMPEKNKFFIPEFMECGSGQVRTNARLFADIVFPCIEAAVNGAMARVLSLANQQKGYIVMNDDHVNVYLAMSFAGGTGSSLMFTVANMLRERYDHARIIGYGVMHSIFHLMDPYNIVTPRIRYNTYASIMELDYFQSATFESPVTYSLSGKTVTANMPLFDEFYVVDNKTQLGGMVDNLNSLCNAIGCSMFYGGTDVGKLHAIDWRKRGLNWGVKSSWVHAFGVCQVVYNGADMEALYRKYVAADLLRYLIGETKCDTKRINEWTERVNLREDGNDYNKLIDWICPPDSIARVRPPVLDPDLSGEEIKTSLLRYAEKNASLWKKDHVSEIIDSSVASLKEEVIRFLREKGGVTTALSFLSSLEKIFAGYKEEMEAERLASKEAHDKAAVILKGKLSEYDECSRKFMKRLFGKHRQCLEQVSISAVKATRAALEMARREEAILVFAALINEIRAQHSSVAGLAYRMQNLENSYREDIRKRELERETMSLFEIDLSIKDASCLKSDINENVLVEFNATLQTSLIELDSDALEEAIANYTYSLPAASRFRQRQIMDIINDMTEEEYEVLKQNILRKSAPLLSLHDRGLIKMLANGGVSPISNMLKVFYISAYKEDSDTVTRFEGDNKLLAGDNVRISFVPSDSESMKQRIFIHRVDSAIMPYCIESLVPSMAEYGPRYNPHYGTDLQKTLQSIGHALKPEI